MVTKPTRNAAASGSPPAKAKTETRLAVSSGSSSWWRERFVTLMVIPERTRQVHKVIVPFFLVRLAFVLTALTAVLALILAIDYIHILSRMTENKRLKAENFKLRQEIQLVRNKVDSMELTIERVRNYAKKLQILTGQSDKAGSSGAAGEPSWNGGADEESERSPASKGERHSRNGARPLEADPVVAPVSASIPLEGRLDRLMNVSLATEVNLSRLQTLLLTQSAVIAATPSLLPINGWLSSPFGYRRHPYDGGYRLHAGLDIAAEPGTPVRAPADGLVIFSGSKEGYGKVVVIEHGYGIQTLFAHNSQLFVNPGVRVRRGEIISQVGNTGMSTGPHLHYEVRKNGKPVNPATFFSQTLF